MDRLHVVKIGGNVIDDAVQLQSFLDGFNALDGNKILVHGGGARATQVSHKLGLNPVLIDGRRVTTDDDLDVAVMVYAGLINKQIVARLQGLGCNAIGLSGADGNNIRAVKRPVGTIDYGWVGNIVAVNGDFLKTIVAMGLVPVLCAISHDGNGQLLNTNADTIAAETAGAMAFHFDTELIYCFDRNGVLSDLNDPGSVIPSIGRELYELMKADGSLHAGMIPKMENCFRALEKNVAKVTLCNASGFNNAETAYTVVTP